MDLQLLREPFPAEDVEWRIGRAGKNAKGVWAMCLAYITNRAIMDRLDAVCGPENWRNEYKEAPAGGVLCGLSINVGGEWVTKWDGADNTDIDAVKGGLSGAMKRAGVQWGIGRYLYNLSEGWAVVGAKGAHHGKADGESFRWDPPRLPDWALPGTTDPILKKMEALWLDAQRHGVGADNEKDAAGLAAVEVAITKGDTSSLKKAQPWLQGAVDAAKGA